MPQVIDRKALTAAEHKHWKTVFDAAKNDPNVDNPGAVATAAIQKSRAKKNRIGARVMAA